MRPDVSDAYDPRVHNQDDMLKLRVVRPGDLVLATTLVRRMVSVDEVAEMLAILGLDNL